MRAAVRSGVLIRIAPGWFLEGPRGDETEVWRRTMRAQVERTGGVVSHLSAARLHSLDLPDAAPHCPVELTLGFASGLRGEGLHRARGPVPTTLIDGLPVTTRARTIHDLARTLPPPDVFALLESALRIDPGRPQVWLHGVLEELVAASSHPAALQIALRARPDGCRPTGSIAETRLAWALAQIGLVFRRQPTIDITTAPVPFHPDFGDPETGLVIEVDGLSSRQTQRSFAWDLARQNELQHALPLLRFTANAVLQEPLGVARNIAAARARLPRRSTEWQRDAWTITVRDPDLWQVRPAVAAA